MIKTVKTPCKWEEKYDVNGIRFKDYSVAESYVNLMKHPEVLDSLKFVNRYGQPIPYENFTDSIPAFCYLSVEKELPFVVYVESLFAFLNKHNNFNSRMESNSNIPYAVGIYYNDYTEAFNGGYGANGFTRVSSLDKLYAEKKRLDEKIENVEKIHNFFNKNP
jgi:hypothetical protein